MPIYEYRCEECGNELERLQRMSDDPLRDCPACEQPRLRRLISAAGFRLKGSGWYETDFKQSGKRNLADSGSEAPASSSESGNGATEQPAAGKSTDKASAKKPAGGESKPAKTSKTTA